MQDHSDPSSKPEKGSPSGSPKSIAFTDKSIKSLQPTDKRRVVWARGLAGLGIRITPKGTKSFVYKYDIDGQDRWMTLGQYPRLKLAEALRKYGEALEKVQAGEDPAKDAVRSNRMHGKTLTVRQLADDYIEKYAKPRKRSWQEDRRILDHDVLPAWGSRNAAKIARGDVIALVDGIVARGAPVQANRTLAVVRRMFNFAVERDLVEFSPCHGVKPPSPESSKDRYLTLNEIRDFWNSLYTAPVTKRMKHAFRLLLATLQRSSEVIGMNAAELDMKNSTWIIPGTRTKNKQAHLVPLSPLAMGVIEELLDDMGDDGYLFPSEGRGDHMTSAALSRAISRNLDHFGLVKFTPHDLRRTGSTQLAAFKVPRFDRDRLLNHTDRTVGAVYDIHEYQEEKRAALTLWAEVIARSVASSESVDANALRAAIRYQDYFDG